MHCPTSRQVPAWCGANLPTARAARQPNHRCDLLRGRTGESADGLRRPTKQRCGDDHHASRVESGRPSSVPTETRKGPRQHDGNGEPPPGGSRGVAHTARRTRPSVAGRDDERSVRRRHPRPPGLRAGGPDAVLTAKAIDDHVEPNRSACLLDGIEDPHSPARVGIKHCIDEGESSRPVPTRHGRGRRGRGRRVHEAGRHEPSPNRSVTLTPEPNTTAVYPPTSEPATASRTRSGPSTTG